MNKWTAEELAHYIYQPDKAYPEARITGFTIKIDFGGFTRTAKMCKDGSVQITDSAKRGKCLAVEQGTKPAPVDAAAEKEEV